MRLKIAVALCVGAVLIISGCGKKADVTVAASTVKPVEVTTVPSVLRQVPASFDETGTFVAEEASDIAPLVA